MTKLNYNKTQIQQKVSKDNRLQKDNEIYNKHMTNKTREINRLLKTLRYTSIGQTTKRQQIKDRLKELGYVEKKKRTREEALESYERQERLLDVLSNQLMRKKDSDE